ncbi:hypothetical protein Rhe02_81160 [Rhizocola hellebori]|uniref:DNA-binding protein n=1 Tax=Rhizocola hellebori TaxID=1392758 RepID=A0A8J3QFL8_9ACTN|nr:hypothetical protein Rhe02_81160 [Rhizocola hellebori]
MPQEDPIHTATHSEGRSSGSGAPSWPLTAGRNGLSPQELEELPVAFPFDPVVPRAFGISRSAAYRALAAGELPITPLRLGRRLIVRRADLLAALSIPDSK